MCDIPPLLFASDCRALLDNVIAFLDEFAWFVDLAGDPSVWLTTVAFFVGVLCTDGGIYHRKGRAVVQLALRVRDVSVVRTFGRVASLLLHPTGPRDEGCFQARYEPKYTLHIRAKFGAVIPPDEGLPFLDWLQRPGLRAASLQLSARPGSALHLSTGNLTLLHQQFLEVFHERMLIWRHRGRSRRRRLIAQGVWVHGDRFFDKIQALRASPHFAGLFDGEDDDDDDGGMTDFERDRRAQAVFSALRRMLDDSTSANVVAKNVANFATSIFGWVVAAATSFLAGVEPFTTEMEAFVAAFCGRFVFGLVANTDRLVFAFFGYVSVMAQVSVAVRVSFYLAYKRLGFCSSHSPDTDPRPALYVLAWLSSLSFDPQIRFSNLTFTASAAAAQAAAALDGSLPAWLTSELVALGCACNEYEREIEDHPIRWLSQRFCALTSPFSRAFWLGCLCGDGWTTASTTSESRFGVCGTSRATLSFLQSVANALSASSRRPRCTPLASGAFMFRVEVTRKAVEAKGEAQRSSRVGSRSGPGASGGVILWLFASALTETLGLTVDVDSSTIDLAEHTGQGTWFFSNQYFVQRDLVCPSKILALQQASGVEALRRNIAFAQTASGTVLFGGRVVPTTSCPTFKAFRGAQPATKWTSIRMTIPRLEGESQEERVRRVADESHARAVEQLGGPNSANYLCWHAMRFIAFVRNDWSREAAADDASDAVIEEGGDTMIDLERFVSDEDADTDDETD